MNIHEAKQVIMGLLKAYGWNINSYKDERGYQVIFAEWIPLDPFCVGETWINGVKILYHIPHTIEVVFLRNGYDKYEFYTIVEYIRSLLVYTMKEMLETGVVQLLEKRENNSMVM